jgi:Uma2 family endonuclease
VSTANLPSSFPSDPPLADYDDFWRVSVEQYDEMVRRGILTDGDPIELLEGWMVRKMTTNPAHNFVTQNLRDLIDALHLQGYAISTQGPIATSDSEPEPDLSIARGSRQLYALRHPGLGEMSLVVEVAESSLKRDRTWKKRIYARAGIPVYWIVNLVSDQIEVFTDPTGAVRKPVYRQTQVFQRDAMIPVVVDNITSGEIAVNDVLPPRQ